MKKYKNNNSFKGKLNRYRYYYFFGYLALYVLFSIVMAVFVIFAFSRVYLQNSKEVITKYINTVTDERNSSLSLEPSDSRMVAIFYMQEPSSPGEMYYQIMGINVSTLKTDADAYKADAFNLDIVGSFYKQDINDNENIVYVTKVENSNLEINNDKVLYIKAYMNISAENSSKTVLVNVYVVLSIVAIVFAVVVGVILSKHGIRPLEELVKQQLDFVSDASHELRTPLAVVQSKLENTLADPDKTIYEASESLVIALNEINRLNKLTQELLTLARNDKDTIILNYETIQLNKELSNIIEPFLEIANIQDRKMTYHGVDCYAYLDVDRLKQIMIIVIDNALKYTNEGDSISINLDATSTDVIIEIKDTGIGISEETKKRIFERFYREDKARSRESGGTGLGLSIAHALVTLQHGKITVDHNTPKGTKFMISFRRVSKAKSN